MHWYFTKDHRSTIRGFVNPRVRYSSPNPNPNLSPSPNTNPRPIYSMYMTVGLTDPRIIGTLSVQSIFIEIEIS